MCICIHVVAVGAALRGVAPLRAAEAFPCPEAPWSNSAGSLPRRREHARFWDTLCLGRSRCWRGAMGILAAAQQSPGLGRHLRGDHGQGRRAPKGAEGPNPPPPENSERSSVQVGSTTSALQTTFNYVPGGLALQDGAKVLMEGTCFNHALQTCCRAHPRELATGGLPRRTWLSSSGSSPTTSRPRSLPKPETALLKQWRDRVYSSKK